MKTRAMIQESLEKLNPLGILGDIMNLIFSAIEWLLYRFPLEKFHENQEVVNINLNYLITGGHVL